jgi:cytochrome c peroxidase
MVEGSCRLTLCLQPLTCRPVQDPGSTSIEQLGKALFFDKISDPDWMSCATCHAPSTGWTGPLPGINKQGSVYRGAIPQRFGNRKPPSSAYATCSLLFQYVEEDGEGLFVGGNFWDGRATGADLGNPAADQARGPFLNPVEQHNYDKQAVCDQVARSRYAGLFEAAYGEPIDCGVDLNRSYDRIAIAIGAYENSAEVNQFSSKYDAYLAGKAQLTAQEAWGLDLFNGKGNCAACHPSAQGAGGQPPLFTDFTFDNLGVPRNPDNPFYRMDRVKDDKGDPINPAGRNWVDPGLGGFLATVSNTAWKDMAPDNIGKHKVPTLRNVAKRQGEQTPKAYMHNGFNKTLKGVVNFYNTRDVKPPCSSAWVTEEEAMRIGCWPAPEVVENVNIDELGNLGLTPEEEDAIVAFMATLSDGYFEPEQQWMCEYAPNSP